MAQGQQRWDGVPAEIPLTAAINRHCLKQPSKAPTVKGGVEEVPPPQQQVEDEWLILILDSNYLAFLFVFGMNLF